MTNKQALKISAIVDKLDIEIKNPKASQEEIGADLMMQLVRKAHKAGKEIIELIADMKQCTIEEAENKNFIDFIKELVSDKQILNFFKSAVKSGMPE